MSWDLSRVRPELKWRSMTSSSHPGGVIDIEVCVYQLADAHNLHPLFMGGGGFTLNQVGLQVWVKEMKSPERKVYRRRRRRRCQSDKIRW